MHRILNRSSSLWSHNINPPHNCVIKAHRFSSSLLPFLKQHDFCTSSIHNNNSNNSTHTSSSSTSSMNNHNSNNPKSDKKSQSPNMKRNSSPNNHHNNNSTHKKKLTTRLSSSLESSSSSSSSIEQQQQQQAPLTQEEKLILSLKKSVRQHLFPHSEFKFHNRYKISRNPINFHQFIEGIKCLDYLKRDTQYNNDAYFQQVLSDIFSLFEDMSQANSDQVMASAYEVLYLFAMRHSLMSTNRMIRTFFNHVHTVFSVDQSKAKEMIEQMMKLERKGSAIDLLYPVVLQCMEMKMNEVAMVLYNVMQQCSKRDEKLLTLHMNLLLCQAIQNHDMPFYERLMKDCTLSSNGERQANKCYVFRQLDYEKRVEAFVSVQWFSMAVDVYREMLHHHSMRPSVVSITRFLEQLKANVLSMDHKEYTRCLEHVLSIIQKMSYGSQDGVDERFYSAILNAISEAYDMEVVQMWLDRAVQSKVKLDLRTFNGYLQSLCKWERFDEALQFVQNLPSQYQLKPDVYTFSILFSGCSTYEQIERAVREMSRQEVEFTTVVANTLLSTLCSQKILNPAFTFYDQVMKVNPACPPTHQTIMILLQAIDKYSSTDERLASMADLLANDCKSYLIDLDVEASNLLATHSEVFQREKVDIICDMIDRGRTQEILAWYQTNPSLVTKLISHLKQSDDRRGHLLADLVGEN